MSQLDWRQSIRDAFDRHGRTLDADVLEELTLHAEASYAAARAEGLTAEDARAQVVEEVASWSLETPGRRSRRSMVVAVEPPPEGASSFVGLLHDLRYAFRLTIRRPGTTAVSVLTMALGIAAATSLFSLAYGVLVRPLPWPEADRLVRVTETRQEATRRLSILTNITYHAWNENPSTIESLAAYTTRSYTLDIDGQIERVQGIAATPSLFPTLRARAAAGRVFEESDEGVVLLSEPFARSRFETPAAALGTRLRLGDNEATVIGVMPRAFSFPNPDVDLWVPYRVPPAASDGSLSFFSAVARLRPGATIEQAVEEATARARAAPDPGLVIVAVFGGGGELGISLVPWIESMTADVKPGLLILLAGVGLLMLAAVGNLASVQLARSTGRRRELAIRASMGAGRLRLARQLLVETLNVALIGGAAGLLLTGWMHALFPAVLPGDFPRLEAVGLDATVVMFAAGLALMAGLLVGLLPAAQAGRLNLVSTLAEDNLAPVGYGRRSPVARTRAFIISAEIAVSVLLLVGAGLLGRSLLNLSRLDPGYDPQHLLSGRIISAVPPSPRRGLPGLGEAAAHLQALPGVSGVAFATGFLLPSTGGSMMAFSVGPDEFHETTVQVQSRQRSVTPNYFDVLGMRFVEGRAFTDADSQRTDATVAVVNRTFARMYLDGRPLRPFGPRIEGRMGFEIVGVVDDVRPPAGEAAEPEMFVPLRDLDGAHEAPVLFLRTDGDPAPFVSTIRGVLREASPVLGFDSAMPVEQRLAGEIAGPRLYAVVVGVFAGFALLIAAVGLFGVLSQAVAQRQREIGVRTALGATPGAIVRLVVGQAFWLSTAGAAAGLLAAAVLVPLVSTQLYGVQPFDPLTFVVVPLALLVAATVACVVPARRAATIDPIRALRQS